MKALKKFLLFINLIFFTTVVFGQFKYEGFNAETTGVGNGKVIGNSPFLSYYNPANSSKVNTVGFALKNFYGISSFYKISVAANICITKSLSAAYIFMVNQPIENYSESENLFNVRYFFFNKVFIGINGKFIKSRVNQAESELPDPLLSLKSGSNIDIGATIYLLDKLQFNVVYQNLLESDILRKDAYIGIRYDSGKLGSLHIRVLLPDAQVKNIFEDGKLYFGVEDRCFDFLVLRAGLEDFNFSAGMGLIFSKFEINYGLNYKEIGLSNSMSIILRL